MNCLDSRRSLLAAPRERSAEHAAHIAACDDCARLARRLTDLDARIGDAAMVPVPDALAHRVLLARRRRPLRQYAAAAAIVLASAVAVSAPQLWDAFTPTTPAEAVGPTHPAVSAIALVLEQLPAYLDEAHSDDPAAMTDALKRLGLSMKHDGAAVEYAGKCYLPSGECEHLVLNTPDGQVSVILVPDYPVGSRVLVADRRMTALVSPAGSGGYIVVAGSPKVAKRAEKLFVKS